MMKSRLAVQEVKVDSYYGDSASRSVLADSKDSYKPIRPFNIDTD